MSNDSKGDYYEDDFMESDMEPEEAKQGAMDALAKGEEMDELKPCPFCGKMPRGILGGYLACANQSCEICGVSVPIDDWNTRPIEDKLLAQLASRDALIERAEARSAELLRCFHEFETMTPSGDLKASVLNMRKRIDALTKRAERADALIARLVEAVESGSGTRLRPRANVNAISLWWLRMNAVISEYRAMKGGEG